MVATTMMQKVTVGFIGGWWKCPGYSCFGGSVWAGQVGRKQGTGGGALCSAGFWWVTPGAGAGGSFEAPRTGGEVEERCCCGWEHDEDGEPWGWGGACGGLYNLGADQCGGRVSPPGCDSGDVGGSGGGGLARWTGEDGGAPPWCGGVDKTVGTLTP